MQGPVGTAAVAFTITFLATPMLRRLAHRHGILDVPNERSSHVRSTPRTGGIAIVSGLCVASLPRLDQPLSVVLAAALGMAVIGVLDDVRGLPAHGKLIAQIVLASVVAGLAELKLPGLETPWGTLALGTAAFMATVLWIVGLTNAFNFMDGINGIAGFQAAISGTLLALLALQRDDLAAASLGAALAAAASGFLPWNFPSGSIFMGDVGSATMGFLLAALVVREAGHGGSFVAAILPLLPFLFDTAVTLARRLGRREQIFKAHRTHYYQRLCSLGWTHVQVTLVWSILALGCALGSLVYVRLGGAGRAGLLATLVVIHIAMAAAITRAEASISVRT